MEAIFPVGLMPDFLCSPPLRRKSLLEAGKVQVLGDQRLEAAPRSQLYCFVLHQMVPFGKNPIYVCVDRCLIAQFQFQLMPPFVCMIYWSIWNIENSSRFFWNMAMADLSTLSCFCGPLVSIWNKDLQLQVAKHWNTTREGEINASIRPWCNVGKPSWFLDVYVYVLNHFFPDVVICWYLLFRLSSKAHCQLLSQ